MNTRISMTAARLDDADAMASFLAPIPNGDRLAELLARGPLTSRAYDDALQSARFVASDGTVVRCFEVGEITIDQAEMIAAVCADGLPEDEAAFGALAALALGPTFEPAAS